jgi:hypothetical protein
MPGCLPGGIYEKGYRHRGKGGNACQGNNSNDYDGSDHHAVRARTSTSFTHKRPPFSNHGYCSLSICSSNRLLKTLLPEFFTPAQSLRVENIRKPKGLPRHQDISSF